jgi:hypothetical protein
MATVRSVNAVPSTEIEADAARRLAIENGPSREAIFDSLRLNNEGRAVSLELVGGLRLDFRITAIEAEDGSGDSWNLRGYVSGSSEVTPRDWSRSCRVYYSTRRRAGFLDTAF